MAAILLLHSYDLWTKQNQITKMGVAGTKIDHFNAIYGTNVHIWRGCAPLSYNMGACGIFEL